MYSRWNCTLLVATLFVAILSVFSVCSYAQEDVSNLKKELEVANKEFTFQGKPINPRAIKLFISWISDSGPAGVNAIVLDGTSGRTNQFYLPEYEKDPDGWVSDRKEEDEPTKGWFSYRVLGKLDNGSIVLEAMQNEGGSGRFTYLLLVKFFINKEYFEIETSGKVKYHEHLALKRMGDFVLGDRYGGKIRIEKNKIIVEDDKGFHHGDVGRTIVIE